MSLLTHLALRLTTQREDIATEALAYVLGAAPEMPHALLSLIGAPDFDEPLVFRAQQKEGNARPDITGVGRDGRPRVLVEGKFWAGLTSAQPGGYLRMLVPNGVLAVVAPHSRLPYLWPELLKLAGVDGEGEHSAGGDLFRVGVGERSLVLVSWDAVLGVLERAATPLLREDLRQLRALCARMDHEAFLPVSTEELTSRAFRRVYEFGHIVNDVVKTLGSDLFVTKGFRTAASNGWYGQYGRIHGSTVLLHVGVHKWMRHAPTPIWMTVFPRKGTTVAATLATVSKYDERRAGSVRVDHAGLPTVAIWVPVACEREQVVSSAVAQVRDIATYLAPLAAAGSDSPLRDVEVAAAED